MESIVLGGGCFWGLEKLFGEFEGVVETSVGYAGGEESEAMYSVVKTGKTPHVEAVQVSFDPEKTSLTKVLEYFFRIHDPTTLDRQGNDIGTQYRSVIFYKNEQQKKISEEVISKVRSEGFWQGEIVTSLEPFATYFLAEDYHQKYLEKNPAGYTCHFYRK